MFEEDRDLIARFEFATYLCLFHRTYNSTGICRCSLYVYCFIRGVVRNFVCGYIVDYYCFVSEATLQMADTNVKLIISYSFI